MKSTQLSGWTMAWIAGLLMLLAPGLSAKVVQTYVQEFPTGLPNGWTATNNFGSTSINAFWRFNLSYPVGSPSPTVTDHTGKNGFFGWVDGSSPYPIICTLQTDTLDFSKSDYVTIDFWHISSNVVWPQYGHNTFSIDLYDGTTWHINVFSQQASNPTSQWTQKTVNLAHLPLQGDKKILFRFRLNKNARIPFYNDVFFDDFRVFGEFDPKGHNNAGIQRHTLPDPICTGMNDIGISLRNSGNNQIDSLTVDWEVNGVGQTPFKFNTTLDTAGGSLPFDTNLVIGSLNIPADSLFTLKIWTSHPNGIADTVNGDDTLYFQLMAGLIGTYTVGGSSLDIANIDTAVKRLNKWGVCGPVIFELSNKVHNARITIGKFSGSSRINTVTFTSQAKDASRCSIEHTATGAGDNGVVIFENARNLIFDHLELRNNGTGNWGMVSQFFGTISNLYFRHCHITSASTFSDHATASLLYSSSGKLTELSVENCLFDQGASGVSFTGSSAQNIELLTVKNNRFERQVNGAINLYYTRNTVIEGNVIHSTSTHPGTQGIAIIVSREDLTVTRNHIRNMQNGITLRFTGGSTANRPLVANNDIACGYTVSRNDQLYGIRLDSIRYVDMWHNSIVLNSSNSNSSSLNVVRGFGVRVLHNNLCNYQAGFVTAVDGSISIATMNFNNLYSHQNNSIGWFNQTKMSSLLAWALVTGWDTNSLSTNPLFNNFQQLIPCSDSLDGVGQSSLTLANDHLNYSRNMLKPDIGAYEFSNPKNFEVNDALICPGDTAVFTAFVSGRDTLIWNNTLSAPQFTAQTAGTYTVELKSICGTAYDTFQLNLSPATNLGNDTNLCEGSHLVAIAGPVNGQYLWSTGNKTNAQFITSQGTYWVQATDTLGCSSTDTIYVSYSLNVRLRKDTSFCPGGSVLLDPQRGAGNYQWTLDGQPISSAQTLTAEQEGKYVLNFTDNLACSSSDSFTLTLLDAHSAAFMANQTQNQVLYSAQDTTAINYDWTFGDGQTASGIAHKVTHSYQQNGTHSYQVTLKVSSQHCGDSSLTQSIDVIGVGWSENESGLAQVQVFPNPSSGDFQIVIESNRSETVYMQITDVSGKEIWTRQMKATVGVQSLQPVLNMEKAGVYFLKIVPENGKAQSLRLVIQ